MNALGIFLTVWLAGALLFATFIDVTTVHRSYWPDRLLQLVAALCWPAWLIVGWLLLPDAGPKDAP